jgi:hypothetical protein
LAIGAPLDWAIPIRQLGNSITQFQLANSIAIPIRKMT